MPVLGRVLNEGPGDLDNGQKLFIKHCATCHTLFGEGNKVGPDLTSADRKNRDALLINILDPSGTTSTRVRVADGCCWPTAGCSPGWSTNRRPGSSRSSTPRTRRPRSRDEIEEINPADQSLMPERLLEILAPQEIRDLFRYLQSDVPPIATGGK